MDGQRSSCPQKPCAEKCGGQRASATLAGFDVPVDLQHICSSVSVAWDGRWRLIGRKASEAMEVGSRLTREMKLPSLTAAIPHKSKRSAAKEGRSHFPILLSLVPAVLNRDDTSSSAASGEQSLQRRRRSDGYQRDPSVIIWWSTVNHLAFNVPRLRFSNLPKPLPALTAWRSNARIHFSHINSLLSPLVALARALRSLPWAPTMLDSGVLCFARIKPLRVREAPTPAGRRNQEDPEDWADSQQDGVSSDYNGWASSHSHNVDEVPREREGAKGRVNSGGVKRVEWYGVQKIKADGRCMFRALVQGMALNKGVRLSGTEETVEADELRLAVAEAICSDEKRRTSYEEALIAITLEESLKRYCERIVRPDFWGGEAELLVLSRMCAQPVTVYIPEAMARPSSHRRGSGFVPIAEYGAEFSRRSAKKPRKPVKLLYNGVNHYDLLV